MSKRLLHRIIILGALLGVFLGPQLKVKAAGDTGSVGSIEYSLTGQTINEAVSNKVYEIADLAFTVPDNTITGKEYKIIQWQLYYLSFRDPSKKPSLIPIEDSGVKLDLSKTEIVDETGQDWTSFFNMQSDGSFQLRTFPDNFYGHTYTIKLYGSIDHPKDYSNYIKDGYLSFPNVYFRMSYNQSGYNPTVEDAPILTDQSIRFLIYTVNANYLDESGNKLLDTIQYGGYSGDQYQTTSKDIEGYHLIKTDGAETGQFTEEPINVNYIYRKNLYSIDAKDSTLFVGDTWKAEDNFVSATDIDGNAIDFNNSSIKVEGTVDTTTPGTYTIKYSNQTSSKTITVTVKKQELVLTVPQTMSFGSIKLGNQNKLFWPSNSKVTVQASSDQKWELSVKLSQTTNSDFNQFIKINDNNLSTDTSSVITDSQGPETVTDVLTNDKFIYVDYSKVTQLRSDTGDLEWTLTPTTKEVSE